MRIVKDAFYARSTLVVARELIGKWLVHETQQARLIGKIVETEAYTQDDPACHGWNAVDRITGKAREKNRGYQLFGAPGNGYVYLNYGMYWLLNFVTEPEGCCGAVLIRAVEPLEGIEQMRARRPAVRRDRDLTNGPGKLTLAFGIDAHYHGRQLTEPPLYVVDPGDPVPAEIETSARIGINKAVDRPWRFYEAGNPFVSPGKPRTSHPAPRSFHKRHLPVRVEVLAGHAVEVQAAG